jgi:regulatory associated protein of mTOR
VCVVFLQPPPVDEYNESWRLKEKMKTSGVALVVCLNIGTDPPDIVKPTPCARRECWFDPTSVPKQKGLEVIGNALQQQYEKWHPKAKYKQSLDPTSSELERTCNNLRRQTRSDRLLLHYNGHGVPRPTKNGEE